MTSAAHAATVSLTSVIQALAVCPSCRSELEWAREAAKCQRCAVQYEVADGIPILLADRSLGSPDEFEHHPTRHKQKQSEFFNRQEAVEFEITRPHETPRLYEWLIHEKFRQSMIGINRLNGSMPALAVCAGSGMDADYLAQDGTPVIAADISLGAARRCRDRAIRYNLNLVPVVADVEHLPFRDRSIPLVYVHDGLHHLEEPLAGLAEMARVASRALSITEPAAAVITRVAAGIGLALEYEDAGNRVARIRLSSATRFLAENGFAVVHGTRYAMYYRHRPGRGFQIFSTRPLFPATKFAFKCVNRLVGKFGNKLTIQALRVGS